jgi:hypothetical protein
LKRFAAARLVLIFGIMILPFGLTIGFSGVNPFDIEKHKGVSKTNNGPRHHYTRSIACFGTLIGAPSTLL